ncbi:MAG: hydrogenase small subunit [Sulfobacillus thermotolerans]|uniref:Hydrogenase n=1 Tax=Sulfobacillus thermotolerans TaxID=338644 RepID=A0ABM6RTS9_9FIRM|nr:hydrogenase [Sulfobacillus thermotolerans]MCY0909088.1 hydrogenase small subunit [Sulfobacillus thermotolerans]
MDSPVNWDKLPKVTGRPLEGITDHSNEDITRAVEDVDRRLHAIDPDGTVSGAFVERFMALGLTRRDFIKWSSMMTAALMLPPIFESRVARAAAVSSKLPVVWINLQDCDGNTESLLRTSDPGFASLILDTISLDYNETVMAAAGYQAMDRMNEVIAKHHGQYVAIFEGSVPLGNNGTFFTTGANAETGISLATRVASGAKMVMAAGTCSAFGGIPAAQPNPTGAKGVGDALNIPVVNISGCPANAVNLVGTILEVVMFNDNPALDRYGRPLWAYAHRIHDNCERRGHFDAGEYVLNWGDTAAQNEWCLFKMGCKGPYTYNNCPQVRWNQQVSWPIRAGHGCIGCAQPNFWDTMTPFEQPLGAKVYGSALGIGIDAAANTVGEVVVGAAAVGIAIHATATVIRDKTAPQWKNPPPQDTPPKPPVNS